MSAAGAGQNQEPARSAASDEGGKSALLLSEIVEGVRRLTCSSSQEDSLPPGMDLPSPVAPSKNTRSAVLLRSIVQDVWRVTWSPGQEQSPPLDGPRPALSGLLRRDASKRAHEATAGPTTTTFPAPQSGSADASSGKGTEPPANLLKRVVFGVLSAMKWPGRERRVRGAPSLVGGGEIKEGEIKKFGLVGLLATEVQGRWEREARDAAVSALVMKEIRVGKGLRKGKERTSPEAPAKLQANRCVLFRRSLSSVLPRP